MPGRASASKASGPFRRRFGGQARTEDVLKSEDWIRRTEYVLVAIVAIVIALAWLYTRVSGS